MRGVDLRFTKLPTSATNLESSAVLERQGRTIVTLEIDGTFDRTGLPNPLVMKPEFTVADGKITELRIGF